MDLIRERSELKSYDIFGDLQDWGRVLGQIESMRRDGTLDKHQPGLARVARYPFNWQLRQAALRAIAELKAPIDAVVDVSLRILLNDHGDLETRILAGNALSRVLNGASGQAISDRLRSEAARSIQALGEAPQPPVLQTSARRWGDVLDHSRAAATGSNESRHTQQGGNSNAGDRFTYS